MKLYFEKTLYIPVCHECFHNTARLSEEPLSQLLSDLVSYPIKSSTERRERKNIRIQDTDNTKLWPNWSHYHFVINVLKTHLCFLVLLSQLYCWKDLSQEPYIQHRQIETNICMWKCCRYIRGIYIFCVLWTNNVNLYFVCFEQCQITFSDGGCSSLRKIWVTSPATKCMLFLVFQTWDNLQYLLQSLPFLPWLLQTHLTEMKCSQTVSFCQILL